MSHPRTLTHRLLTGGGWPPTVVAGAEPPTRILARSHRIARQRHHTTSERIIARTLVFGASALLAAGFLTWSPSSTTGWEQGSAEATLWQLLNGARTNNGMAPLQQHGGLLGIARWRSQDMLDPGLLQPHHSRLQLPRLHATTTPTASRMPGPVRTSAGTPGSSDARRRSRVHEQFMGSAGHRANVLTAAFTHGAVGAAAADGRHVPGKRPEPAHVHGAVPPGSRALPRLPLPLPLPLRPSPGPPRHPSTAVGGGGGGGGSGGCGCGGGTGRPAAGAGARVGSAEADAAGDDGHAPRRARRQRQGLDGVTTLVIERPGANLAARLAADDALGIPRYSPDAATDDEPQAQVARGMEVTAAAPAQSGLFDGIVGALLGFLFG